MYFDRHVKVDMVDVEIQLVLCNVTVWIACNQAIILGVDIALF